MQVLLDSLVLLMQLVMMMLWRVQLAMLQHCQVAEARRLQMRWLADADKLHRDASDADCAQHHKTAQLVEYMVIEWQ